MTLTITEIKNFEGLALQTSTTTDENGNFVEYSISPINYSSLRSILGVSAKTRITPKDRSKSKVIKAFGRNRLDLLISLRFKDSKI